MTVPQFIATLAKRGIVRSPITIRILLRTGTLHGRKRGRDWDIPRRELLRYIDEVYTAAR